MRQISAILPLYQAHQSSDSVEIRQKIRKVEAENIAFSPTDREERLKLRYYINQLNFIAQLVDQGLVSADLSKGIFFEASQLCLTRCEAYIQEVEKENKAFAAMLKRKVENWNPEFSRWR